MHLSMLSRSGDEAGHRRGHSRPHSPFASLCRRGLGTRNEGLWRHRIFEFFDWLLENKGILSGSENIRAYLMARNYEHPCFERKPDREKKHHDCIHEDSQILGLENPLSPEPFVSRAKAPPAKRSEKGYGGENEVGYST